MSNTRLFVIIIASMWGGACLLSALWLLWCARRPYAAGTHEGATLDSTVVLTLPEDEPAGRHHEDTVVIVPSTYQPHIGRRLIARETNTQRIEWPQ